MLTPHIDIHITFLLFPFPKHTVWNKNCFSFKNVFSIKLVEWSRNCAQKYCQHHFLEKLDLILGSKKVHRYWLHRIHSTLFLEKWTARSHILGLWIKFLVCGPSFLSGINKWLCFFSGRLKDIQRSRYCTRILCISSCLKHRMRVTLMITSVVIYSK